MTLHDQLAAGGCEAILDTHGESVVFYPEGDSGRGRVLTAIVSRAALEGRNMVPGDGPLKETRHGRKYRHTIGITVKGSDVTDLLDETHDRPDAFLVFDPGQDVTHVALWRSGNRSNGTLYRLKHVRGQDGNLWDLECVKSQDVTLRRRGLVG